MKNITEDENMKIRYADGMCGNRFYSDAMHC